MRANFIFSMTLAMSQKSLSQIQSTLLLLYSLKPVYGIRPFSVACITSQIQRLVSRDGPCCESHGESLSMSGPPLFTIKIQVVWWLKNYEKCELRLVILSHS